jgi:hypothetical protein
MRKPRSSRDRYITDIYIQAKKTDDGVVVCVR